MMTFNLGLLSVFLARRWRLDLAPFARERLAAAPAALVASGADVILLQELFAPQDRAALLAAVGDHYPFHASPTPSRKWLGNGLLMLSRIPLHDIGFVPYADRDMRHRFWQQGFLMATVQDPELGEVRLLNTHLSIGTPLRHPGSVASMACRDREIGRLLSIARDYDADIVGGDFNCGPEFAPANYGRLMDAGYQDCFTACNGPEAKGYSWSSSNPVVAAGRYHDLPDHRLDHLLISHKSLARLQPKTAGLALTASIVETRTGIVPLSDHYAMCADLAKAGRA